MNFHHCEVKKSVNALKKHVLVNLNDDQFLTWEKYNEFLIIFFSI